MVAFFSCVLTSIFAFTCVRLHQKMIPFSRVRLHPNICYFLGAPCLYFLVCIYINFVSFFSCAPSSEWLLLLVCAYIKKVVPYSRVRLHPNVCFYLGAPALKCLHFLVCAYIFMFAFFSCAFTSILRVLVCAYVKKWFLFLVRVFIKNICFFSFALTSKCLLLLGCACIKMFLASAYINFCVYLCMRKSKWFLSLVCANIKIFAYICVHVLTSCVFMYLSPPTSK